MGGGLLRKGSHFETPVWLLVILTRGGIGSIIDDVWVWFLIMHTRMGCKVCHCVHPTTSFLCALVLAIYKFAYQSLPASKSPSNKMSLYPSSILRCPFWTSYAKRTSIYSFTFFVPRDSSTGKKKKKSFTCSIYLDFYTSYLLFFLLTPFTFCTMLVWHPFFTQIFSFLPLFVFWVGQ